MVPHAARVVAGSQLTGTLDQTALEFREVSRTFRTGANSTRKVLDRLSLSVGLGEKVAIMGKSGSGKSTLLHLAAGIDLPSEGEILITGQRLTELSERQRTLLRRDRVGLVFQFFHLLPHLTVEENVVLPDLIAGRSQSASRERAQQLLERVELGDRAAEPVQKLSGGEMQRVAICRALMRRPALLLADEPTGNLDDSTGEFVMDLILQAAQEEGSALVYVTHDNELASRADRRMLLQAGSLDLR